MKIIDKILAYIAIIFLITGLILTIYIELNK